jgi:uncharacterized protein DUF4132/HEAT repeat protein
MQSTTEIAMSRIQQALRELKSAPQSPIPINAIEQYLRTGDGKTLAQFKPAKQTGWSWNGYVLAEALGQPPNWTEEDRRLLHVLHAVGLLESLGTWLNDRLKQEKPGDDVLAPVRAELESLKVSTKDIVTLLARVQTFTRDDKPTSAGRFLLTLSDADLLHAVKQTYYDNANLDLIGFILDFAPERIPQLLPVLLKDHGHSGNDASVASLILHKGQKKFEKEVHAFFQSMKDTWNRFHLGQAFFEYDPARYRDEALQAARASLAGNPSSNNHGPVGEWMVTQFGKEVLPDLVAYLAGPHQNHWWKSSVVDAVAQTLKQEGLPAFQAALKTNDPELALSTLPHLMALGDHSQDDLICQTLQRGIQESSKAVRFVTLAAQWNVPLLAESLWGLLVHKSKPVRDAAARGLAKLGDTVLPRAGKLLLEKKADVRQAAVTLLTSINSAAALKLLEKRVDDETDDNVRDAILLGLESAWAASGRKVTKKDVQARIARAAEKLKEFPVSWIKEAKLPALKFKDGKPVGKEAVRYLLYRQSRAKEIRADVEAKALYGMIDRSKSGDFALEIVKGFLGSKADAADRWALTLAGLLGDDRMVPVLNQQIKQWADSSRGKMAEYAVEALSLLGSDAALLTIDALAIRYRSKNKNVGRAAVEAFAAAAENLGITPEELGDRVVPWLGFEPGKPRIIDCGSKKVEARIGLDLKLRFVDLEKNKPVASLPKTAPKEAVAEFKELGATLREVVKAQVLRLENLMVRQHRWEASRWNKLFPVHPLLLPLAARIVWGAYNDSGTLQLTFRALEDRTFTQASDEPCAFPKAGTIGIVHPLELSEEDRRAWQTHLADYEITPPFPQMERPVVLLTPDRADKKALTDYAGININGMTFKGRADRLGWSRGSVIDAGGISSYAKSFPAAGVDVFLGLDGMYIGIDMYSEIKLQDAFFVKSGSVKTGSYTYDEPANEKDNRVLRFGDVPPIVYSEVLGDLQKIAGKKEAAGED